MLALSELNAIKERAKMPAIKQKTQNDHVRQWAERVKKQRDLRQKERRAKFEEAEIVKRQVDQKEAEFQQALKNELIVQSNKQIFENNPNVRRLQSKRLFCETQYENEKLQQIKQAYEDFRATQDQYLTQKAFDTVSKRYFDDIQQTTDHKQKVKENKIEILAQAEEFKNEQIQKIMDLKVEGQIVRQKAENELKLQKLHDQKRLERNVQYKQELQKQVTQIKKQQQQQQEEQELEQKQRQEHDEKKQIVLTIRKKREKQRIEAISKLREAAIAQQETILKLKSDNETGLLEKHKFELEEKVQKEEDEKLRYLSKQKKEIKVYTDQIRMKKLESEQKELEDIQSTKIQLKEGLSRLDENEKYNRLQLEFRKHQIKDQQMQQIDERSQNRNQQYMITLQQELEMSKNVKSQEDMFEQWANDQMEYYSKRGVNVMAAHKELEKIKKDRDK